MIKIPDKCLAYTIFDLYFKNIVLLCGGERSNVRIVMFAKRFDRFHDPEEVLIEMTRRQRRLKYVLSENKEETMYFI